MTYQEALHFLYTATPVFQREGGGAYKPGLETTRALDCYYQHPHTAYRTIHVAGTNGKGSTSHSLASILMAAGYRVGLFTSPHLVDFRERIRVDGEVVSEEFVTRFVAEVTPLVEQYRPSFFELTTLMALVYFREAHVDIAVIEVGMGGRLDSTNIIQPLLSIITGISLDHTQYLGETLTAIAGEKAGIIKAKTPVVIGHAEESEVRQVFVKRAQELGAPITFADEEVVVSTVEPQPHGQLFTLDPSSAVLSTPPRLLSTPTVFFGLQGSVQRLNLRTILSAVHLFPSVGLDVPEEALRAGLREVAQRTGLRGRWEVMATDPLLICDTGHNEEGIRYVTEGLRALGRPLRIIFGMVSDKDITSALSSLPPEATYYFTEASVPRAMPSGELLRLATECGLRGRAFPTLASALETAQAEWERGDVLFVGGSNFLVADLLEYQSTHKL